MRTLEELEDAYSFLRDPAIGSAIKMIKERDARIVTLEAALTRIVWAEHNAELSSSTMIEMADIAHAALAGEKKDE